MVTKEARPEAMEAILAMMMILVEAEMQLADMWATRQGAHCHCHRIVAVAAAAEAGDLEPEVPEAVADAVACPARARAPPAMLAN